MTVKELIRKLEEITDKDRKVYAYNYNSNKIALVDDVSTRNRVILNLSIHEEDC